MDPISITLGVLGLVAAGVGTYYARKQYLAIKTPPPVKDSMRSSPALTPPAPETRELDLLPYKKWLKSETLYIDIRGIAVGGRGGRDAITFPLVELYADLYVQRGPTNLDVDDGRLRTIRLTDLVESTRCSLITGDPGAGKTTFLRYLAQKKLNFTMYGRGASDDVLPVFIYLPELYKYVTRALSVTSDPVSLRLPTSTLVDFVVALSDRHGLGLTHSGFLELVQAGKVMWLLDSLDELTATNSREAVVEFLSACSREFELCKFIVTSRPSVVQGKSVPVDFQVVNIEYMQPEEIRSFLQKWFSLLHPEKTATSRQEVSNKLFDRIVNTHHLRLLAKNPVMLTSIAVLDYNSIALPERKVDLLEAIISWLITAKNRGSGQTLPAPKENIYGQLALRMFEHPSGRQLQVGRKWAASKILHHFESEQTALDFLSKEENETGLLVQRGEGDLAFWLTWFQEYLAAKEIVNHQDSGRDSWWAKIRDHIDDPDWHEVISMVPACLNRLGSNRVNLFFERLGKSCGRCDFQSQVRRIGLGGHILRDLFFNESQLPAPSDWVGALEKVKSVFADPSLTIDLKNKYEATAAIGQLRAQESNRDSWVRLDSGEMLLGSQADDSNLPCYDKDSFDWEKPVTKVHLSAFEIRKTPTSVREFADFVNGNGYGRRDLWKEEGWAWRISNKIRAPLDWQIQLLIPNCPVTGISWFEALAYCEWLSRQEGQLGMYSLPSEAQWEFSYKTSSKPARFSWGNTLSRGNEAEANWLGCGLRKKSPIGMFPKSTTLNGLVDMIGNVEEWCLDNWSHDHSGYNADGSARIVNGSSMCIVRGGSTIRPAKHCRPTYRSRTSREKRYHTIGFRVVRPCG